MGTAEELLERAKAAYRGGCAHFCAAALEAGRLLHEYVLAYLRQGDGLGQLVRLKKGLTRRRAVRLAREALGVSDNRIHVLIATWAVVELLAGGDAGGLPHETIHKFSVFVRRKCDDERPKGAGRNKSSPVSDSECWELRPGRGEVGRELYRRAAAERWTQRRTARELAQYSRKRFRLGTAAKEELKQLKRAMAHAGSGDIAELCLDLARRAEDPWAVAQRLIPELQRLRRPRQTVA